LFGDNSLAKTPFFPYIPSIPAKPVWVMISRDKKAVLEGGSLKQDNKKKGRSHVR
jgi:hypothetical protein